MPKTRVKPETKSGVVIVDFGPALKAELVAYVERQPEGTIASVLRQLVRDAIRRERRRPAD